MLEFLIYLLVFAAGGMVGAITLIDFMGYTKPSNKPYQGEEVNSVGNKSRDNGPFTTN